MVLLTHSHVVICLPFSGWCQMQPGSQATSPNTCSGAWYPALRTGHEWIGSHCSVAVCEWIGCLHTEDVFMWATQIPPFLRSSGDPGTACQGRRPLQVYSPTVPRRPQTLNHEDIHGRYPASPDRQRSWRPFPV